MKGRVLVIDDEPEIRRNLTVGLTREGYTVVACPDGISAVHEMQRAREKGVGYDYLVTGIFMPDIDGLKILKVIKSRFPELPVLVITGFGDEALKSAVLSEENTAYLDKPFAVPELVSALEKLAPGRTTLAPAPDEAADEDAGESAGAYLMLRITEPERSLEVFQRLGRLEGVASCDAVRGDVDLILLARASGEEGIRALFDRVRAIPGVEVASLSPVERPKIDVGVSDFIRTYRRMVKADARRSLGKQQETTSYILVDIDRDAIERIFTTVCFIDEVVFCDVIEGGARLVGMIMGRGAAGRTPRIVEKISQIDGVLRVREAKVIRMLED